MSCKSKIPSLSKPVDRVGPGQLSDALAELSEERLTGSEAGVGAAAVPCICIVCSCCSCAYDGGE